MFMGEFNHTVDDKGRVIIPAKFRDGLGEVFVVSRGLDGCLFVHDNEEWARFTAGLTKLPLGSKKARDYKRYFNAGAESVTVDKQGRALVSETLRHGAGIDKEVVVIGAGDHIEIWDRDRWHENMDGLDIEAIAEEMAGLGTDI
jgi:MraZ protein